MIYTASQADMQEYAQLIAALTQADLQRQQCIDRIAAWEKAHQVPEDPEPAPEGEICEAPQ